MATTTTNLGLKKQEPGDRIDPSDIDNNMDLIDAGVVLKNQGVANAGKFLRVDSNGIVTAVTIANASGVNF